MSLIYGEFPTKRPRRLRSSTFIRNLVRETSLSPKDLILPVFVLDGSSPKQAIPSMPGVFRQNIDDLLYTAEECLGLGIPAMAIFPVIEASYKSEDARAAYDEKGLVPRTIERLKKSFPELGLITDVALDPYTSHGQDGLIDSKGYVLNDETVEVLCKQALCHAQAGADIVAPSDMMDGRIAQIRQTLDADSKHLVSILSYAAKYASAYYGPFRDAVGSKANLGKSSKENYQMDPGNSNEALQEVALDLKEGADIVMVKPGLIYLDIITKVKQSFCVPTFAYQVSGEYAMIEAAAKEAWLDKKSCVLEAMLALKRAGSDAILSYHATEAARWLQEA